ncbi:MAG TPA: ankyrin repeat domain-containing protein [Pyrinomonadaceae bacterium]|nr:ankyrin repeat domain-containing protein [Pyrinomonadaceae bacterium]
MSEEFFSAVKQGDAARVKGMLKDNPALAQAKDQNGLSPLMTAAYYRKKEVVAALLEAGMELNIFEAAATGQAERLRSLLSEDPSVATAFSSDGFTPLGLAGFFGHRQNVELLLNAGADVNAASREAMKVTPLHSAAAAKDVGIAGILIEHGANVNAKQPESGFTPLHEAAANGDMEFASLLVNRGAEVNAEMNDGKTPLAFALERNQSAMAAFLQKHGAR